MRIVIDLQACQNGSRHRGIGRYAMSMARAMVKAGRNHEFIIALNRSFSESVDDIRRSFEGLLPPSSVVTYSVPPMATAADPSNAWRNRAAELVRAHFLESLAPDVVFVPSLFEGFWDDTVVSVERDAPYLNVITLHDLIPLEDPARHLGGEHDRAAYFRRLNDARHADLLLAVSRYAGDDAIAKLGIADHKVVVAYGGVDEQFRAPKWSSAQRADILEKYGISRPYVMMASPLEPRKNIEGLIAGYGSMSKSVRDGHQLVFAGKMDSFAQRYIHDLARAEGMDPETIVLPGFVSDADLPALYHYSSTFAFPSFSEGFGLPLLEAMACGAPVVGSSKTSIPEVVGRSDLAPDPANIVEIGRAIERILANPSVEKELRDFGPRRAALFTWEKSATVALDALEKLLRESRPSTSATVQDEGGMPSRRMEMALLMMDVPPEHRLSGVNNALAAALADRFDLTIISTSRTPVSEWLQANCAIRNVEWFETHADHFHHILYSADYMADAAFRRLMRRQKGDLILVERLAPPAPNKLTGRRLFDGAELAMFEAAGFGGLSRAAANEVSANEMIDLLIEDLASRAAHLYVEADSAVGQVACRTDIMPIALSDQARRALCEKVGVNAASAVIVAVAADDDAASRIIRDFRTAFVAVTDAPSLVVFCDLHDRQPGDVNISKLVSGVVRISCDLDAVYCGLLSTADVLIVDDGLPDAIRKRMSIDCPPPRLYLARIIHPVEFGALSFKHLASSEHT